MPVITYTAKRSLIGGHTVGLSYKIETQFHARPRGTAFSGERRVTLDGTPESWLDDIVRRYQILSDYIAPAALPNWREFLDSVINGEYFQIDFTGTIASPGTDVSVWMESTQWEEREVGALYRQFNFQVREV